jgi:hypothetical protein
MKDGTPGRRQEPAQPTSFAELLAQARERVQSGQYLNDEQFWRELGRSGTRRSQLQTAPKSVRKGKAATPGR